jgi:hypothetical protein
VLPSSVDRAVFAPRRADDLARERDGAGAFRDISQVPHRERAVDVQPVTQVGGDAERVRREDEAIGQRHRDLCAEELDRGRHPLRPRLVPVVIERPPLDERAERAVRSPERPARGGPIGEAGPERVGRLRLVDEVVLVDAEEAQQVEKRRQRRLRFARRYGFGRIDDVDGTLAAELAAEDDGGGPTGGAATHDGDPPDSSIRLHCDQDPLPMRRRG